MDTLYLRKSSIKQIALLNKNYLIDKINEISKNFDYVFFEGDEGYVYRISTRVLFAFNLVKDFQKNLTNERINDYLSELNHSYNRLSSFSSFQRPSQVSIKDIDRYLVIYDTIKEKIDNKNLIYDNGQYSYTIGTNRDDFFSILPTQKPLNNNVNLFNIIEGGLVPKRNSSIKNLQGLVYNYYINNEIIAGNVNNVEEDFFPIEFIKQYLLESEYRRIQTEVFNENVLLDYRLGLWELHESSDINKNKEKYLKVNISGLNWHSRDPKEDIVTSPVAIDFGTSSTVVAFQDGQKSKLLRIGSHDLRNELSESDFENPTVLQFFDIDEAIKDYNTEYFKPETLWTNIFSSHRAMDNLKQSSNDTKIVTSIFPHLKPWANHKGKPFMFKDAKGKEFVINNHDPKDNYDIDKMNFDPIEYYAYLLGLFINKRKIYTRYYLTFPVKFAPEVRNNILISFKRGLIRSLPYNLIDDGFIKDFVVKDYGIEPIAYLVTALRKYELLENDSLYYSVFDFGGGTTDFAYGKYRKSNEKELDDDIFYVIENFAMGGDSLLGGENILNNLAFKVFTDNENLSVCRECSIPFICPKGEDELPGLEYFLDNSTSANANMSLMRNELREFWLNLGNKNEIGIEPISANTFLNKKGEKIEGASKSISIPVDLLKTWVYNRIYEGIREFIAGFRTAFKNIDRKNKIHVFLSGNASKSLVVQAIFEKMFGKEDDMNNKFADDLIEFINQIDDIENNFNVDYHLPLVNASVNPEEPNCKTGTALGLLEICNYANNYSIKERKNKFGFILGKRVRENYDIIINSDSKYGKWYDFGKVNNETKIIDILLTNQQSVLLEEKVRYNDERLSKKTLHCNDRRKDLKCFISAIDMGRIKIAFATEECNIEDDKTIEMEL